MQQAMMSWKNLRQLKGKSVQGYTHEFRKRALILGISLDSPETFFEVHWWSTHLHEAYHPHV